MSTCKHCDCGKPGSPVKCGTRIELLRMPDDPDPILPGATGTVVSMRHITFAYRPFWQIDVNWDNGRTLMLNHPVDRFRRIE